MAAHDTILGYTTAAGTTETALTVATGDSLTIRQAPNGANIVTAVSKFQGTGFVRITSPKLHDSTNGIGYRVLTGVEPYPRIPLDSGESLQSQDILSVSQTGSATGGDLDLTALLLYYPVLPGSDANLINYFTFMQRKYKLTWLRFSITAGTSGGWSGATALTSATQYYLKANTQYAVLGMHAAHSTTAPLLLSIKGTDTGSLRASVPCFWTNMTEGMNWFPNLARLTGQAVIPVINSANAPSTVVELANDENALTCLVDMYLMELR